MTDTHSHCGDDRVRRPEFCFLDYVAGAVLVIDTDGVVVDANRQAASLSSVTVDELIGRRLTDPSWWPGPCVREDGSPLQATDLPAMRALATGEAVDDVFGVLLPPDGEPFWLLLSCRPVTDDDGSARSCVVTMTDVTAQKRAETMLTSVAAQLHGVLHALPDLFFHLDPDGVVMDYHIGAGFDGVTIPEDYLGRTARDLLPSALVPKARAARARCQLSGQVEGFEGIMELGAEMRDLEFRYAALPERETVLLVRDITERRRAEVVLRDSEARYRGMFVNSRIGMFAFDRGLHIVECNARFSEQAGMPQEYFAGLDLRSLDDQRFVAALREALGGELGTYEGDYAPTAGGRGGRVTLVAWPVIGLDGVEGGIAALLGMDVDDAAADDSST